MNEVPTKGLLDILPAYINFVIGFLRSPSAAFKPYALKGRVQSDLTSFMLAGVGATYLVGVFLPISRFNIKNPRGPADEFAKWLTHQEANALPLVALLVVLAVTLAGHPVAKLLEWLKAYEAVEWGAHGVAKLFDRRRAKSDIAEQRGSKTIHNVHLSTDPDGAPERHSLGSAEDSVNAAIGFAAVFLPLMAILLLVIMALDTPAQEERLGHAALIVAIFDPPLLFMFVAPCYLVKSFAAVHKVSCGRAAWVLVWPYACISGALLMIIR